MLKTTIALSALAAVANAKVIFKEDFSKGWRERWVDSTFKGDDQGEWKWVAPKIHADKEADKGIQTSQDSKYYGISAKFPTFSNKDKDLVVQFQVTHEQGIDCGGGYVKIYGSGTKQEELHGETPYNIMFGPDICGSTKIVHLIFAHEGKNLLKKVPIQIESDTGPHIYTLVLSSDNTYKVLKDNEEAASGKLEDDWDFLLPKEIPDPEAKKPEYWDDRAEIPDPESKKPDDWDEQPEFIVDPEASKPADWDDEDDGEWEAPLIKNPEFKGSWTPKMLKNPAFKGLWTRPLKANPEYKSNDALYLYEDNAIIGFDLWQVKSGSIFDNVIVTDSLSDAKKFAKETFEPLQKYTAAEKLKEEERKKEAEKKTEGKNSKVSKEEDNEEDVELIEEEDEEEEDNIRDEL